MDLATAGRRTFDMLPPRTRRTIRTWTGRPGVRAVPLDRLDHELEQAGALFRTSEDDARRFLASIELEVPGDVPADPFSDAYRAWTWELYHAVSGRSTYTVDNEASPFEVAEALRRPYPYQTGSATVVGEDLAARGHVLQRLGSGGIGAEPPARIVEFGPGWGNLTMDLVQTGFEVTAVEVDERFCELLVARADGRGHLEVCREDMATFDPPRPFDVALFFESFHHCADHLALLGHLRRIVVPGGAVVFAGEPVQEMPYPWGPRTDGLSLWSMRTYGWLELGFTTQYFTQALARTGWTGRWYRRRREAPSAAICVARRADHRRSAQGGAADLARAGPG